MQAPHVSEPDHPLLHAMSLPLHGNTDQISLRGFDFELTSDKA
jgi:hypothetical protein